MLVSMPEELLARLDRDAEEQGKSRSRVLQEAASGYLVRRNGDPDRTERSRQAVERARALSRTMSWKPGRWEDYVREDRDSR